MRSSCVCVCETSMQASAAAERTACQVNTVRSAVMCTYSTRESNDTHLTVRMSRAVYGVGSRESMMLVIKCKQVEQSKKER